ncbi:MAG: CocE/NonD family hydrolase [Xanthomonadaceae bacterium]|nr:CocE/NonD family hydrolase [Xanthomonadaceae bacterium]MDZ4379126.1 CocE/NonD family hydrolase [Xanthomonadaceae bacterium]
MNITSSVFLVHSSKLNPTSRVLLMRHCIAVLGLWLSLALSASVQAVDLQWSSSALGDADRLGQAMQTLAADVLKTDLSGERREVLSTQFRLQMVAGQPRLALASLDELVSLRELDARGSSLTLLPFKLLAKARLNELQHPQPLPEAIGHAYREMFAAFDDRQALDASYWFDANLPRAQADFDALVSKHRGQDGITREDAIILLRNYHFLHSFQALLPLTPALIEEDSKKRFITDEGVLVRTPDGAQIAAMVVRPRASTQPLTSAMRFTIYADEPRHLLEARHSAARGYAGVVAYTRGKGRSPDAVVPYEFDGRDAGTVVNWIASQPWSDGQVGMYGGSYDGFTQWAALKNPPAALKTIVPYVANNPGNGLPMENNIFLLINYAWPFYTTNNKTLDYDTYYDSERWNRLNEAWFTSGKSYRSVDAIDGTANVWLQRWLSHPSYDHYWQAMLPFREEFAKITIPVLTITGYYDDGQASALDYFRQHTQFNSEAEHYVVIGPYDHAGTQSDRKPAVLRGYSIDPIAQFDTTELTYQWLGYVMRGGKKPDMLQDKVNYEVMGENRWRHAASIEKMHQRKLRLYLSDARDGSYRRLSAEADAKKAYFAQNVDFADRSTRNNNESYPDPIVGKHLNLETGFAFVSEPLPEAMVISGQFSGEINLRINKRDLDLGLVLYEVQPDGTLFQLSHYLGRASYAKDATTRQLLSPGKTESITFDRTRVVSKRLEKGSRLLLTLDVNKNPFAQINYGTGKEVNDEDIRDAKSPLRVQWLTTSYIELPVSDAGHPFTKP